MGHLPERVSERTSRLYPGVGDLGAASSGLEAVRRQG